MAALQAESDRRNRIILQDVSGREKEMELSQIVRFYPANGLSLADKLGIYFSRWGGFLTAEPRDAGDHDGLILAMARDAGEVAPLMLVGVVKLAPTLPFDGFFPFIHLERSFMHLGFHIFDVGFQSRNSEAGKPIVFVTTLLLFLIVLMNSSAIYVRNRLKRKYSVGQF